MKLATYHLPSDARTSRIDPRGLPGTSWAQFGDELLLYADETEWGRLVEGAGRSALPLQERQTSVKQGAHAPRGAKRAPLSARAPRCPCDHRSWAISAGGP